MQILASHRRVIENFPHLGYNILTFYISIRLLQWTTHFLIDPSKEVFFNINPLSYIGTLHVISFLIGLFLIFKVFWSPLLAQLYQLVLVAHPFFLPTKASELIMTFIVHGLWILYFSFSPLIREVYGPNPLMFGALNTVKASKSRHRSP